MILLLLAGIAVVRPAEGVQDQTDIAAQEAISRLQEYIRVNTINPPGNESRAVDFFAAIFEAEGIEYETAESAPGRGNIWARIEGGDEPALVLLHHSDVVPADEAYWSVPPLSGVLQDGHIYGRGTLDTKASGIIHLQAFLALHRMGVRPNRDVVFMATADEEAGGMYGAGWLVANRPELFENVGWLLNEGGGGDEMEGRVEFGIEVTQKVPLWLRLVATGEPGHGSTPRVTSSVNRIVRALYNIQNHSFEPRIIPAVDTYFKGIAANASETWQTRFADMRTAILDPEVLLDLQLYSPFLHALTRNACSITMVQGSSKINVVPPEASAQIDCRLLPDQDPDEFIALLTTVINDPMVGIETIMRFTPAVSTTDTDLYRAIERVTAGHFPDASILPNVQTGFTDSHFFRDLGIVSYGFTPIVVPASDASGVHGNNERISVENVTRGTAMMVEILLEVLR